MVPGKPFLQCATDIDQGPEAGFPGKQTSMRASDKPGYHDILPWQAGDLTGSRESHLCHTPPGWARRPQAKVLREAT